MASRRRARQAALQMLYQMDVAGVSAEQAIETFWSSFELEVEGASFANDLVRGVGAHRDAIDETIRSASQNWRLERMARVDRNVLRLGVYELVHLADVPRRVTLNEMIELGKRFGTGDTSSFVNGVLDRIATDLGKA